MNTTQRSDKIFIQEGEWIIVAPIYDSIEKLKTVVDALRDRNKRLELADGWEIKHI